MLSCHHWYAAPGKGQGGILSLFPLVAMGCAERGHDTRMRIDVNTGPTVNGHRLRRGDRITSRCSQPINGVNSISLYDARGSAVLGGLPSKRGLHRPKPPMCVYAHVVTIRYTGRMRELQAVARVFAGPMIRATPRRGKNISDNMVSNPSDVSKLGMFVA